MDLNCLSIGANSHKIKQTKQENMNSERIKEIQNKLKSVERCMTAHPDFEKGSEFEDRVVDLQEIQKALSIDDDGNCAFLVQDKNTLLNHGLFSSEEKAKKYISGNTRYAVQRLDIVQ